MWSTRPTTISGSCSDGASAPVHNFLWDKLTEFTYPLGMPLIDLKTAVVEIRQAVTQRAFFNPPQLSPFFFIVGAGISHPPIPLAGAIENDCRLEAGRYKTSPPPPTDKPIGTYSYWFEQAYPSAEGRQHYLRKLMENASISNANFRLAHLLLDKKLARIVVTPNFDDFLSRALQLFGRRPIVCDHPRTLERISVESQDLQIIHVHGSYWFYDCCNLTGEIDDRAQRPHGFSFTTRSSLEEILRFRSPLVVGYSGWAGDVIMSSLQTRLSNSRLGNNLYWFCHKRSDVDLLPDWLKIPEVRFVVPDELEVMGPITSNAKSHSSLSDVEEISAELADKNTDTRQELRLPTLLATDVFDALIKEFNIAVPDLTKDPLGFFANQLRESLLTGSAPDLDRDIYQIRNVIERVERARSIEISELKSPTDLLLEDLRNAVRKSDYPASVDVAARLNLAELDVKSLRDTISILANAASALDDKSSTIDSDKSLELKAYDLIAAAGQRLQSAGFAKSDDKIRYINALLSKAVTLGQIGRSDEELQIYDLLINEFKDEHDQATIVPLARAPLYKGITLAALDRNDDAIKAYDKVEQLLDQSGGEEADDLIATSLLYRASVLTDSRRRDEAITIYENLVSRFEFSVSSEIQYHVATALNRQGNLLRHDGNLTEAVRAYTSVQEKFNDAVAIDVIGTLCTSMVNKAVTFSQLEQYDDCIRLNDEVIERFADLPETNFQVQVARSSMSKASALAATNRRDRAIATYDNLLHRLEHTSEPRLKQYRCQALIAKGIQLSAGGEIEEAIKSYERVVSESRSCPEIDLSAQVVRAMMLKASVQSEIEDKVKTYDEIIARFAGSTEGYVKNQVERARSLRDNLKE